jgi:hypothetical protein
MIYRNPHEPPNAGETPRTAQESDFAPGPGSDAPAKTRRPARDAQTPKTHPLNRPLASEDKSLTGPQLAVHPLTPVRPTETFTDPEFTGWPGETFEKDADIAAANANFQDASHLLMRPKGAASNG